MCAKRPSQSFVTGPNTIPNSNTALRTVARGARRGRGQAQAPRPQAIQHGKHIFDRWQLQITHTIWGRAISVFTQLFGPSLGAMKNWEEFSSDPELHADTLCNGADSIGSSPTEIWRQIKSRPSALCKVHSETGSEVVTWVVSFRPCI